MKILRVAAGRYDVELVDLPDCKQFAISVAKAIRASLNPTPVCIALSGTLGAGKTQWTRYFCEALGAPSEQIGSPTFVLVQRYDSDPVSFHIDAYRLNDLDEFLELGIEEILDSDAITMIEWADRFPEILPINRLELFFESSELGPEHRHVKLTGRGDRGIDWIEGWFHLQS